MIGRILCGLVLLLGLALSGTGRRRAAGARGGRPERGSDPIFTSDYMVRDHGYMVYDTLFSVDEQFTARPQMVDTWNVGPDGLTWTFRLRPQLAFSDGQKVTSADVVASLRRWQARDGFGQMLAARTATLEAIDPDTFRIVLKQPWGLVAEALGKPSSMVPFIMPARIAATAPDKQITEPVGSGPFIMRGDLWMHGAKIVYDRNPAYVPRAEPANGLAGGKRALIDRVEWIILPDPATAAAALQKAEIDLFDAVPPDLAPVLAKARGVKLMPQDSVGVLLILRPNSTQPPFDDPRMRQALRYAIDQTMFRGAYSDDPAMTMVCESFLACTSPYSTTAGWTKPDLEKARALVRESHYDGKPVVVLDVADYFTHPHALVVGQMLKDIGLNPDVQSMDLTTWVARRAKRDGWSLAVVAPSGIDAGDPLSMPALRANCDKAWAWLAMRRGAGAAARPVRGRRRCGDAQAACRTGPVAGAGGGALLAARHGVRHPRVSRRSRGVSESSGAGLLEYQPAVRPGALPLDPAKGSGPWNPVLRSRGLAPGGDRGGAPRLLTSLDTPEHRERRLRESGEVVAEGSRAERLAGRDERHLLERAQLDLVADTAFCAAEIGRIQPVVAQLLQQNTASVGPATTPSWPPHLCAAAVCVNGLATDKPTQPVQ